MEQCTAYNLKHSIRDHNFKPHFYQTRSAWSVDQGSNKNDSPAYSFASTVTKFCVMWEGLSLPHDTKFGNCRCKIVDSRSFPSWSFINGLRWSGLILVWPSISSRYSTDFGFGWNTVRCCDHLRVERNFTNTNIIDYHWHQENNSQISWTLID